MLLMSKEVSDKDRSMKTQLLMTSPINSDEKVSGERVWKENGFFKEIKPEMNIDKANVPEKYVTIYQSGFYFNSKEWRTCNVRSQFHNWSVNSCSKSTS